MNINGVLVSKIEAAKQRATQEKLSAKKSPGCYKVTSGENIYKIVVSPPNLSCTCKAGSVGYMCKHIGAVLKRLERENTINLVYGL